MRRTFTMVFTVVSWSSRRLGDCSRGVTRLYASLRHEYLNVPTWISVERKSNRGLAICYP